MEIYENVNNPYAVAKELPKEKTTWKIGRAEVVYAVFLLCAGFLFWEGSVLLNLWGLWGDQQPSSGIGTFLFFWIMIAGTFLYFSAKRVKQNRASLLWLSAAVVGALPFILYDAIDVRALLLLFEFGVCLLWVATSAKTQIAGFVLFDLLNQGVVVSFLNFGGLFQSLGHGFGGKKEGRSVKGRTILVALLGILISIPILVIVLSLLISADSAFESFIQNFQVNFNWDVLGIYFIEFFVGVPVACYLGGLVFGNAQKRNTARITEEGISRGLSSVRLLPRAGLYAPLLFFVGMYVIFFVILSGYLLAAFSGYLPSGYTYAEYARRGFFELCAVAAINLGLLAFSYLFLKRGEGECPKMLRIISLILSVQTVLLIATAMSKMILYIDAYGLSRLRLYTSVFMVLLMLVFVLIIVWHIRPFRFKIGMPIAILTTCFMLTLFLANTDGLIAKYNVDRYLEGDLDRVDVEMFTGMSDAVAPAVIELATAKKADEETQANADEFLRSRYGSYNHKKVRWDYNLGARSSFEGWNLQSARSAELVEAYFEEKSK
ncbi:MAG: DUF4173 domain-containing protein [Clostridiales Family XIII bacterium]|jgi:hypothetical protein|nr:DUF4173 domain-containing protein [Clostridiales Family XIII bacterium]